MFGMGMSEILIICAVALLVFGPQQLPEMAKKIAKGLKEVRRASDDLKRSINLDDDDDRPRWKPPVPRPPLQPSPDAALEQAIIPGSTLANGYVDDALPPVGEGAHGEDEVPMVHSAAAVSVGSALDIDEPEVKTTTTTKEA